MHPASTGTLEPELNRLVGEARELLDASRAESTRRAYRSDWADFEAFCGRFGWDSLPAEPATVALYATSLLTEHGHRRSTIQRRLSAISTAHGEAGLDSPVRTHAVRKLMSGLRRSDHRPVERKRALSPIEMKRMAAACGDDVAGTRDRALLLVGFVGGLRRSELVALDVADLERRDQGLVATIRRSKTDQSGEGRQVVLPYGTDARTCPVRAVDVWLDASQIADGPIFRRLHRSGTVSEARLSAQSVALVVKRTAAAVGIRDVDALGAHSLRSGFATAAALSGASERAIANQTGHRSMPVLRSYIQRATVFDDNAATELSL